jgi:hypothetical protein
MGDAWKSVYDEQARAFDVQLSRRSWEKWAFRCLVPKKDVPQARLRELRVREWLIITWNANDIAPHDDRDFPFSKPGFDPLRHVLSIFECPVLVAGCYQLRWKGMRSSCYRDQLAPYLRRIRQYALVARQDQLFSATVHWATADSWHVATACASEWNASHFCYLVDQMMVKMLQALCGCRALGAAMTAAPASSSRHPSQWRTGQIALSSIVPFSIVPLLVSLTGEPPVLPPVEPPMCHHHGLLPVLPAVARMPRALPAHGSNATIGTLLGTSSRRSSRVGPFTMAPASWSLSSRLSMVSRARALAQCSRIRRSGSQPIPSRAQCAMNFQAGAIADALDNLCGAQIDATDKLVEHFVAGTTGDLDVPDDRACKRYIATDLKRVSKIIQFGLHPSNPHGHGDKASSTAPSKAECRFILLSASYNQPGQAWPCLQWARFQQARCSHRDRYVWHSFSVDRGNPRR